MFAALSLVEESVLTDSRATRAARLENEIEQIYRQTHGAICSYVRCLGVPQSQAQEVAQEVYLRLYQTMRKGEEILNVRAWLFRLAHNLSLNLRSRHRPSKTTAAWAEAGMAEEVHDESQLRLSPVGDVAFASENVSAAYSATTVALHEYFDQTCELAGFARVNRTVHQAFDLFLPLGVCRQSRTAPARRPLHEWHTRNFSLQL
jgi:DNA-directed RNA polymerase specialized sigma24 family protein